MGCGTRSACPPGRAATPLRCGPHRESSKRGNAMRKIMMASMTLLLMGDAALAQQAQQRPMTDQDMIASATSAAPKAVAEGATVVVMDANYNTRTLRRGTNGWTCMPD